MAYSALSREELLDAMDQFLDDSIVLPPGDWDQDLILPLMHERTDKKRKRGERLVCVCIASSLSLPTHTYLREVA